MKTGYTKMSSDLLVTILPATKNPIEKCGIICELAKRGNHSSREKDAIRQEIHNHDVFWNNYLVSDFATAALHILLWDKYDGKRSEINQLIDSKLMFE